MLERLGDVAQLLGLEAVRGGLLGQLAGGDDRQPIRSSAVVRSPSGPISWRMRSIATRSSSTRIAIGWEM